MNITFRVLWCEDVEDWLAPLKTKVSKVIRKATCLEPYIEYKTSPDELNPDTFSDYDLFLLDFNYNSDRNGKDIIQALRENSIYTNVLLYSADPELSQKVAKYSLDGVYYTKRDDTIFLNKIEKVAALAVKKILDVNAIRGLFLSSVANIEGKLNIILNSVYENNKELLSENKLFQSSDIIKRLEQCKRRIDRNIASINDDSFNFLDLLNKPGTLDLTKKVEILSHFLKSGVLNDAQKGVFSSNNIQSASNLRTKFRDDIIQLRNKTAHVSSAELDGIYKNLINIPADEPLSNHYIELLRYIVYLSNHYYAMCDEVCRNCK